MIEPGQNYRTKEGLPARVYCNDAKGRWPVHGSYLFLDHWLPIQWSLDGQALAGEKYDLVTELIQEPQTCEQSQP